MRKLWRQGATEAVLEYLGDTWVGCWSSAGAWRAPREAANLGEVSTGAQGGPGLSFLCDLYGQLYELPFPLFFSFVYFHPFLCLGGEAKGGAGDWGAPVCISPDLGSTSQERLSRKLRGEGCRLAGTHFTKAWTNLKRGGETEKMVKSI